MCIVVVAGLWLVFLDARAVHHDLQRMFEELREVALTRALLDDLRGIEQWVEAVPDARPPTHGLVLDDVRHHHRAATATFARFHLADDPSEPTHTEAERGVQRRIHEALGTIAERLQTDGRVGDLAAPLAVALHSAGILAHTVEEESREIGAVLDQRSDGMTQFMLLLGVASAATVGALAWLLRRRVLVPVRELRAGAQALGRGQDVRLVPHHPDELGDLATAFTTMACQLQENRRDLEARVEERSREVLRSARLAELGTLAAGIAHEINNPLASIAACAEGLLREAAKPSAADGERLREYLQIIRKEAMRTRDITTRLLRFAHREPTRRETVWLGTEIREVAPLFEHQLADAGVALAIESESPGPAIVGDASEWRQVLFNLLRNALDASPRGGTISLRCTAAGAAVEISVADQGPGIPRQAMDRIFEPFFTTKEPGQGTGLGLAIVHRIVTAHGGTISVSNRSTGDGSTSSGDRGARFVLRVPRAGQ